MVDGIGEPGAAEFGHQLGALGKVRNTLRKVPVRRTVTEQCADAWHDPAEVDAVAETNDGVVRHSDIEEAHPTAGSNHPCALAEEIVEVDEVAESETADDSVDRTVGDGQIEDVRLGAGCTTGVVAQHSEGQVHGDGIHSRFSQIGAQVARSCGKVQDQ